MKYYCSFYRSGSNYVCIRFDEAAVARWKKQLQRSSSGWKFITGINDDSITQYYDAKKNTKGGDEFVNQKASDRLIELGFTWKVVGEDADKDIQIELMELLA